MSASTMEDQWTAVDRYIAEMLVAPDPALDAALKTSSAAGLPAINVSPNQGKLLQIFARLLGARMILEIGTLGGYSTIWMARALPPGGRLVTLEADPRHAELARANITRAGLEGIVDLRLGKALHTLPVVEADGIGPFDLVFIDADKANTPAYFTWALKLARVGALIVVDNVVRKGAIADAVTRDPDVQGMRRFYEMAAAERRVDATAIQTVGSKGYDGFSVALVRA
jgi:predicted O-methyltransferase YrrM